MSSPAVPQRPSRSPHPPASLDEPKVPPRPTRKFERSLSRDRENFARSPLNESPFQAPSQEPSQGRSLEAKPAMRRPPSVASLPLVGQEGAEYASLEESRGIETAQDENGLVAPNTTSKVSSDLPLHAPKASAGAGGTSRLAEAANTDSVIPPGQVPVLITGGRPASTAERPASTMSTGRPPSATDHRPWETDIPEIGVRVPMYPNAGDVQAPTPGPSSAAPSTGIGFFNNASRPTTSGSTVGRRKSAQFQAPPGSYGLHGHGLVGQDQFEKSWYEKHPEEAHREETGAYGPAVRPEPHDWTMSSDQLNKLVRESGRYPVGTGPSFDGAGTPTEQIGYLASDQYASRSSSPKPIPLSKTTSRGAESRPGSATFSDSPLRQASFADQIKLLHKAPDAEGGGVHVDPPPRRRDEFGSSGYYDRPSNNLGPADAGARQFTTRGSGSVTPILASDETAKNPQGWLLPAVSPEAEKHAHDDEYFTGLDERGVPKYEKGYRSHSRSRSRNEASSRPSSIHGASGLSRFISHDEGTGTPLEEISEFEPLFEEDETASKPKSALNRLKRPELEHRFPSQDIWEDTPHSLQLETTVDTPEEPAGPRAVRIPSASAVFESPEQEALRRGESSLPKPKLNAALKADVAASRPGLRQRFPSSDIWEDTPDSQMYTTTVEEDEQPPAAEQSSLFIKGAKSHPAIPPRPSGLSKQISPTERKAPAMPDRPKPKVADLPTAQESTIDEQPATAKAKPAVPARPAGATGKFASLKSSFMNDLNSRLQLGPKPPPKAEEAQAAPVEEEAVPLSDARKGRARGPVRRKPAASPTAPAASAAALSISPAVAVWSITSGADLTVNALQGPTEASSEPERQSEFEAQRVGFEGDVPESGPPQKSSEAPILAPDASTPQLASSTASVASAQGHEPAGYLTSTRAPADPQDPHQPDLIDADAEAERQQELSKLPAAANVLKGTAPQPQASMVDDAAQTGEQKISDAAGASSEQVKITLGGNAQTGEDVVQ